MNMKNHPVIGWLILALCMVTTMMVYTVPTVILPVLFAEISAELDLDIMQLGVAWGSISLSSLVIGLFGGALGDRFGSKHTLAVICLLTGLSGALRGFASDYAMLVATFMLYGLVAPSMPPNLHKAGAYFFPKQRTISTGSISLGFAIALFLGARYTATWLSPAVGGWRNVMFMFGVLGVLFSAIWMFAVPDGVLPPPSNRDRPFFGAIRDSLRHVLSVREVWIIGIAATLFWGCFRGLTGYTPFYLRGLGWDPIMADRALSNFFLASLILALPLSIFAERSGNRKLFMVGSMVMMGVGVLLLGFGQTWIPIGLIVSGLVFDAFMAMHHAAILDLKAIGSYAGSALGVAVMFRELGGFIGPPVGNWLAQFGAEMPFFFWGTLGLLAAGVFLLLPGQAAAE